MRGYEEEKWGRGKGEKKKVQRKWERATGSEGRQDKQSGKLSVGGGSNQLHTVTHAHTHTHLLVVVVMRMKAKLDVWIHSCSEINCWPLLLPCVYMQWLELYSTSLHSSSPKSFAVCFRAVDIFSKFNSCLRCRRSRESNRRTISSDLSWTAFLSSSTWPWSSSSPVHTHRHTDTQIYIHVNYTSTADTYTHRHAINIHVNYTAYIQTDR